MASTSWTSRGLVTGMAPHGGTLRVGAEDVLVHICVDGHARQADTLYVFAYVVPPGAASLVHVDAQERQDAGVTRRIASVEVPAAGAGPILVLNGVVKSQAARIYARAPAGDVALFGYYTRQTLSLVPTAHTIVGSLVLSSQTVTVSSARESVVLNPHIPITYIVSNHTSEVAADAFLGAAADGTFKIITLIAKHPTVSGDAGQTRGNVRLSFNAHRFPMGYDDALAVGTITFKYVADSAKLVYSSAIGWMIAGAGATVD